MSNERFIPVNRDQYDVLANFFVGFAGTPVFPDSESELVHQICDAWERAGVGAEDTRPVLDLLSAAIDVVDFAGEPDAQELIAAAMRSLEAANRWAAFTDDELMQISGRVYDARMWVEISKQAQAEIERRKTGATS